MSVVTNWPAVPNRLWILFRYLLEKGEKGEEKDRLKASISPASLQRGDEDTQTGTTLFDEVLKEAKSLGLVEDAEGTIRLCEKFTKKEMDHLGAEALFIKTIERLILDPSLAQNNGQKNVAPALAWFLMQDPANPFSFSENPKSRVVNDLGEETKAYDLKSKEDFQNLAYWARYLGYCSWISISQTGTLFVPDPTNALGRHLRNVFSEEPELRLVDCISRWAVLCPVLEGGAVRQEVEALARPELKREPGTLSPATSLALRRLEERKTIDLKRLSDADVITLHWDNTRKGYSHITYKAR